MSCYAVILLYVISGILAGGIRGFRIVLCYFAHTKVWRCDVYVFEGSSLSCCLFAIPIPEMIQCHHLSIITFSKLDPGHFPSVDVLVFFCGCLFGVFLFCLCGVCVCCCFCFFLSVSWLLFCLCVFVSLRNCNCNGLCTGPILVHFCAPHWVGFCTLIHLESVLCNMQLNV